jgi:hypothetical protein
MASKQLKVVVRDVSKPKEVTKAARSATEMEIIKMTG